ncbi:MAG: CoB--CoM heterodisulfide reductase iron-sulfur subunit A family protein, partial [Chloroflexi bacterium]|nr:CoB--CoM heterodisulfide reductase iron-sulfur subunit A family protein [Chloroflexota bacterium]
ASVVNITEVVKYTKTLPGVVYVEDQMFACATDSGVKIQKAIKEHGLNRMIIAACTPRTHEPLFQDTLKEVGLNPYLMDMANIRNQCSWVHMNQPELATEKAKNIIQLSVIKAKHLIACQPGTVQIKKEALIVGGGISGMTAALELADQDFPVHLLERTTELGGNLKELHYLPKDAADPQAKLIEIIEKVTSHKNIKVYTGADIKEFKGSAGEFRVTFEAGGKTHNVEHGAVIVATGGAQYTPTEFLYGQNDKVITQREMEEKLAEDKLEAKSVVMIQCVGSRDEEHPYCSRICCVQAIKNALKIKEQNPETSVFVLYRDIRAYSLNESEYTRARENGVRFLRFEDEEKPKVSAEGDSIKVSLRDPILDAKLNIKTDLLVLSAGIVPNEGNDELSKKLKLPLTEDKFFLEAHIKLRPVDFATDGIFLCGLAHSPK